MDILARQVSVLLTVVIYGMGQFLEDYEQWVSYFLADMRPRQIIVSLYHWLNYSKVGGGTQHFLPSLSFPSLPQSSPPFPFPLPSPIELGQHPSR